MKTYNCYFHDTKGQGEGFFRIKAFSVRHAEKQVRDGYFGLLGPTAEGRSDDIQIKVIEICGL